MTLLDTILGAAVVLAKDSGKADDVARLLGLGLAAFSAGTKGLAAMKAVNAELQAMQDASHQPTREEKDAKYNAILVAIDSAVKP